MCDILSEKLGNQPKKKPESTVSINPENKASTSAVTPKSVQYPTIDVDQFSDFVPIENNANDSEIGDIIKDIQEIEAKNE